MTPDDPQDLESALAAYRRLPRAEPSAALDAAIRARARAAVATRSRPRWPVLFATAATLVLAASLGWRTWRDGSEQPAPLAPPEARSGTSAPTAADTGPASAGNAASTAPPLQDARARAEVPAQAAPPPPLAETVELRANRAEHAPQPAAQPLPQAFDESAVDAAKEALALPAPPAPPVPAAPSAPAPAPLDAPSALGRMKKAEAAPAEAGSEAEVAQSAAGAEVEADAGRLTDAAAAPAPASAAVPAGLGAVRSAPAAAVGGREPERRQASADAATAAADALEPIRELLRQGRRDEAREALQRWRREWPDAVVPEDLRTLLQ